MTVKEFKEWLDSFPEDAIVEIAFQEAPYGWESYGPVEFRSPEFENEDIVEGCDYSDFTQNKWVKEGHRYFNKKVLQIGVAH